ncbi:DHH family phosphoesterase [Halocalculus aciditolerans]|uniref:DHH family phosphoesterase n=1 Tax=Halocalculus aciditolerans TaxID=1383812 RepID=A0A830FCI7_9EURY|nr:DHH family phosphoesterase [Halocalculus aciditolerans]
MTRLLLGCGATGHDVLDRIEGWHGDVLVLDPDASRVESLRNEKTPAERVDVTDADALDEYDADIVFVASDDAGQNVAAARAADAAFADACCVGYTGLDATTQQRDALGAAADRVVSLGDALADRVADAASGSADARLRRLREVLADVEGTLGVFAHDNPDPDAIAAAVTLCRLAETVDVDAEACYFGDISHQENRAFVNLLDIELTNVEAGETPDFDAVALVDHSHPGVNDQLDPDTEISVVVDHHPSAEEPDADFVDVRVDAGSTSTILVDYLERFNVDFDRDIATALLYGIRVDTDDFRREVSVADFEAAATLTEHADWDVLERIETPSVSADTLDVIATAIGEREVRGNVLSTCVGRINDRDALAQAADRLLAMQGLSVTFVYGFMDGTVYASARARGADVDLGEALRTAFDEMGSAGGHADMAGAQLDLGLFDQVEEDAEETLRAMLEESVGGRFFEAVQSR